MATRQCRCRDLTLLNVVMVYIYVSSHFKAKHSKRFTFTYLAGFWKPLLNDRVAGKLFPVQPRYDKAKGSFVDSLLAKLFPFRSYCFPRMRPRAIYGNRMSKLMLRM